MKNRLIYLGLVGYSIHLAGALWVALATPHGALEMVLVLDIVGSVFSFILLGECWVLDALYPATRPDIWEINVSRQFRFASIGWWPMLILANFLGIYPRQQTSA